MKNRLVPGVPTLLPKISNGIKMGTRTFWGVRREEGRHIQTSRAPLAQDLHHWLRVPYARKK